MSSASDWRRARQAVLDRDEWRCCECGYQVPQKHRRLPYRASYGRKMSVDHIVPKSLGGTNAQSNLRAMCADCNGRRGNGIDEFRQAACGAMFEAGRTLEEERCGMADGWCLLCFNMNCYGYGCGEPRRMIRHPGERMADPVFGGFLDRLPPVSDSSPEWRCRKCGGSERDCPCIPTAEESAGMAEAFMELRKAFSRIAPTTEKK